MSPSSPAAACLALAFGSGSGASGGPSSSSRRKPSSSSRVTPSSSARGSFEPGFSPTITKLVFFETLPVILPPRAVTAAAASSRVNPSSPPVSTKVRPVRVCSSVGPFGRRRTGEVHARRRAASRSARGWSGSVNQARMLCTMTGPIAVDGFELLVGGLDDPVQVAERRRECARGGGPTWRMPSATSTRDNGCCFDASIPFSRLPAEISPIRSSAMSWSWVTEYRSPGVLDQARGDELVHPLLAEPFDVHRATTREVDDLLLALHRAVRAHAPVVRLALEPHQRLVQLARAGRRELPLPTAPLALHDHRADDLGDHVARLAHDHGVADPHVLARDLVLVVQGREPDGGAADEHRLEHRERASRGRCARCSP